MSNKRKVNVKGHYVERDGKRFWRSKHKREVNKPKLSENKKQEIKEEKAKNLIDDQNQINWKRLEQKAINELEDFLIPDIKEAIKTLKFYIDEDENKITIYRLFNIETESKPDKFSSWSFDHSKGFKDTGMQYITHLAEGEIEISNIDLLETIEQNIVYPEEFEVIIKKPERITLMRIEEEESIDEW
jgi:hypothetical protein